MPSAANAPVYMLYGENQWPTPDMVHCESIAARSRLHCSNLDAPLRHLHSGGRLRVNPYGYPGDVAGTIAKTDYTAYTEQAGTIHRTGRHT